MMKKYHLRFTMVNALLTLLNVSIYVCMLNMKYVHVFSLVPVLVQFSFENSPVAFLLAVLAGLLEVECLGGEFKCYSDSGFVDDLPGSPVTGHSSLRCSSVCSHLQADDIFAFGQLFL